MSLTTDERRAIVDYRIEKSRMALCEAQDNFAMGHYSLAVQRMYYAAYYAASALLVAHRLEAQTHAGVKTLLHKEFVQTGLLDVRFGRMYSTLLQIRHTGDYDDSFDFTKEDVEAYMPMSVELTNTILSLVPDLRVAGS